MNYLQVLASALVALTSPVFGDDKPQIVSPLNEGKASPPPVRPPLPKFRVFWKTEQFVGGRKVTMKEVEAPDLVEVNDENENLDHQPQKGGQFEEYKNGGSYFVHAQVFQPRGTLFTWHSTGDSSKKFSCWSNVDARHLGGFSSFAKGRRKFGIMLLTSVHRMKDLRKQAELGGEISIPRFPRQVPLLRRGNPRFVMKSGDQNDLQAMRFIRGLHQLYRHQKPSLVQAYRKRVRAQRRAQLERENNPPKPKDIEVQFWENEHNLPENQK